MFLVRFRYTCPPRKILGCVYEASKEHVFHKCPPFRFILISFIQRRDTYEKQVLYKVHKTPPIILRGGHVYLNITQNTFGMGGLVFSVFDLG